MQPSGCSDRIWSPDPCSNPKNTSLGAKFHCLLRPIYCSSFYHFSSPLRLVSSFCSSLVILTRSHLLLHAGLPDYFLRIAECHPICDKWNNLWRLFSDGFLHSQDSLVFWRWKKWENEAAFCIPCMWYAAFSMLWQRHFSISGLFFIVAIHFHPMIFWLIVLILTVTARQWPWKLSLGQKKKKNRLGYILHFCLRLFVSSSLRNMWQTHPGDDLQPDLLTPSLGFYSPAISMIWVCFIFIFLTRKTGANYSYC